MNMKETHRSRLGLKILIPRKRKLRRQATHAEQVLWKALRAKQFLSIKFKRQHGIGPYIVDFCAPRISLVIEIDGDVHAYDTQKAYDEIRQKEIQSVGYSLLRFSNEEVLRNLEGVLMEIAEFLKTSPQSPPL